MKNATLSLAKSFLKNEAKLSHDKPKKDTVGAWWCIQQMTIPLSFKQALSAFCNEQNINTLYFPSTDMPKNTQIIHIPALKVGEYYSLGKFNLWALPAVPKTAILLKRSTEYSLGSSSINDADRRLILTGTEAKNTKVYQIPVTSLLVGQVLVFNAPVELLYQNKTTCIVAPPEFGVLGISYTRDFDGPLDKLGSLKFRTH